MVGYPQEARRLADAAVGVGGNRDRRGGAPLQAALLHVSLTHIIGPSSARIWRLILVQMLTEFDDEEVAEGFPLRERQEREIALGHSLANAEHELAREAAVLGRTLERAGISFDPLTFIALRIIEGSRDEHVDPVDCLNVLGALGFLERSVELAVDLLDEAA